MARLFLPLCVSVKRRRLMQYNDSELISQVFYNRESKEYGAYKVIKFVEERGKSKVRYYLIKFKDSGNTIEASLKNILDNTVIDIEVKKKATKKRARAKKKEAQESKYIEKRCLNVKGDIRLLALDVSSHSTGFAVYVKDKLVDYGYFYQPSNYDVTVRLNNMKKKIQETIFKYDINAVVVEDIIFKNKIALYVLSRAQGIILDWLYENNIEFSQITPRQWKSKYNINKIDDSYGSNSREESKLKTVACVKKDFGLDIMDMFKVYPKDLKEPPAYDVCDAICLGKIALDDFIVENLF